VIKLEIQVQVRLGPGPGLSLRELPSPADWDCESEGQRETFSGREGSLAGNYDIPSPAAMAGAAGAGQTHDYYFN
jgi:hypothetical protein